MFDKYWLEPTETGAQPKKNGDVNRVIKKMDQQNLALTNKNMALTPQMGVPMKI